ncbi:metallophosphoesterase [Motiliproteus sp. MSK22-1]|uniref:metallophosphoesterase n=1 Tax=Motiliproteus sp. MSK22-1 TaxID=1897630 RepID=UPI000977F770|nr:metallophosphoesterase [Motiliproteus sp. MSK22-1]OMH39003.1 metallophosphoesterase [Motiliproteus sp. MSK22-1]
MDGSNIKPLEERIGRMHLKLRLGIEGPPQRVFGGGLNFLHLENSPYVYQLLKLGLKISGLYGRGNRNARDLKVVRNQFYFDNLPSSFDGVTLLHLSDLHLDMDPQASEQMIEAIADLDYDVCVLTGDYRASTSGPIDQLFPMMERLAGVLTAPVYAVLGNHDSIRMVSVMESLGIRMLLNESVCLQRNEQQLSIAGIDDAHYYRVDNLEKAAEDIPKGSFSILLSHTPEIYRQATHAGFRVMFCGHTHGGQICLPGGVPIILEAHCPRTLGRGSWSYGGMQGYTSRGVGTSILPVRFNCPPEITLHRLSLIETKSEFS